MKFTIIIEKGNRSYGAYSPDFPDLISVAKDRETAKQLAAQAILERLKRLEAQGEPLPSPKTESDYVEIEI